jgi:hypothetical protein
VANLDGALSDVIAMLVWISILIGGIGEKRSRSQLQVSRSALPTATSTT